MANKWLVPFWNTPRSTIFMELIMSKAKNSIVPNNTFTEFLLYTTPNGKVKVEIFLHNENIWLTQEKIAQLFGVQRPAITKHLKNIFETGELNENSVSSILEHTAADGKNYPTKFYNLDAIISVGYRVNSTQATHFRIWATERLKNPPLSVSIRVHRWLIIITGRYNQ